MVLPHTGDTNTDGQMNIGTRVRGYLLAVYCAVRLYIHGFVEMVGQGWQRIELDESIDGEYFRGRVVLCTGGASGIGLSVCRILCSKGATVVAAGLQPIPDQSNSSELRLYTERGQLHYIHLNLASFKSIHEAVKEFSLKFTKLDVLINNAGVMLLPQMKTAEGFEQHMGVNFIGHSLLTKLLLTKLKMAAADGYSPQIVNVASSVHKIAFVPLLFSRNLYTTPHVYSPHLSYIQSKLAVVLYSECLAQQLSHLTQSSVRVHSVHPGVVASSLYQHTYLPLRLIQKHIFAPMFFRTVDEGSFSILNSIVASTIANGSYVENGTCSFLKFVTNLDKELFWKFISQMIYKTECDVKIK